MNIAAATERGLIHSTVTRRAIPLDAPTFVAGHRGLVGFLVVRRWRAAGFENLLLMENYDDDGSINAGTGEELSICELASRIRDIVAPGVEITLDTSKRDGTPRKLLDASRLHNLVWCHRIALADGLASIYEWFCAQSNEPSSGRQRACSRALNARRHRTAA
jgi:hypothetical protein